MQYIDVSFLALISGMVLTSFIKNKKFSGFITLIMMIFSSFCIFYFSLDVIIENKFIEQEIFSLKPLLNSSFTISIDSLSALFLLIISLVSFCVSLFSWKYLDVYKTNSPKRFYPFLILLFIASIGVVSVKDFLFFIVFWELMTLSSWFLVIFEREKKSALKGGLQYFIATHVTTAFLILASVILYSYSNDFSFKEINKSFSLIIKNQPYLSHFILFCIFIAFVTKAGVLPFGFWLPNTYPQPPSSASSFFGGVMSKLAVYALFRFFCSVIPFSFHTQIWGFIIASFGVFSIFVGTIAALTQDEAKRLMSFHAIGQVGYMFLGIGVGLYFIKINPFLASIALVGGLFHVFNNSIYKSLLFLNAGSIFYKTGTTDLNKVSGLMKVMPLTAITALIGSLSIAGVPPFNGFISKLLIFESSIWSAKQSEVFFLIRGGFIVFGIISVFISAVTLASFLKFVNSAFMGKLQGTIDEKRNLPWSMVLSQIILAFICLLAGLFPFIPLKIIYNAVIASSGSLPKFSSVFVGNMLGVGINFVENYSQGAWFPIFIMIPLIILTILIFSFERYAKAPKRDVETWYGGKEHAPEEVVYKGHSFYQPFKDLVSFKIGKIQFKGFYPVGIPAIKFSVPESFLKILRVDEWLYYPIVDKLTKFFEFLAQIYNSITEKYIIWLIFGSIFIFILLFYFSGGR
ncbi:complex I subunit 5 family protein [Thermodesulfovibrio yellowstonii]|uniref:complex I subunit 5 family protein n=1 Tax=Thermodesulfovibrio yellowstonii TaxID=28262 RepID=UPI0003FE50EC|nr:proton-conducting transporter membrane subunit [Thermodesulfovibrio islandicus]